MIPYTSVLTAGNLAWLLRRPTENRRLRRAIVLGSLCAVLPGAGALIARSGREM